MNNREAKEWLKGERSNVNIIPPEPRETREERINKADAASLEMAYWILRAKKEGLV